MYNYANIIITIAISGLLIIIEEAQRVGAY
jgi:hypothetical protein